MFERDYEYMISRASGLSGESETSGPMAEILSLWQVVAHQAELIKKLQERA